MSHYEGRDRYNNRGRGGNREYGNRQGYAGGQAGFKRGRDDGPDPAVESKRNLIVRLFKLGDRNPEQDRPPETDIEELLKLCLREIKFRPDLVQDTLLDCAVELSAKTPYYATLVGLINAENNAFIVKFIDKANEEFNNGLAKANCPRARMLLRFFAALVVANVLHPSAVLSVLEALVDAATSVASSAVDPSGYTWQPWTDYLVYIVAAALPWAGAELSESAPGEMARLMEAIDGYLEQRPIKESTDLRPFFGPTSEEDLAARSDSGGASFLVELWSAVKECATSHKWSVQSIPKMHTYFEQQLATGLPHELPHTRIPVAAPGLPADALPAEAAAQLLASFPPRGGISLLDKKHTQEGRPLIERLVAEEYIIDTLTFFHLNRDQCVKRLATGLPLPYAHELILAQTLFSQMLRLPQPQLNPIAYGAIIVDLIQAMGTFARAMSACVRECFSRLYTMEPLLRQRLADWLAYHLSCCSYVWPWDKWARVLTAPEEDAQRQFCKAVLGRLVRLSYYDNVKQHLPPNFHVLLGPPPAPTMWPPEAPAAAAPPPAEGAEHMEADAGGAEAPVKEEAMDEDGAGERNGGGTAGSSSTADDPEGRCAGELMAMMRERSRAGYRVTRKFSSEELGAFIAEQGMAEKLGGPLGVLRAVTRACMADGAKSVTHMAASIAHHEQLLRSIVQAAGQGGEEALLEVVAAFWQNCPQKAVTSIDRLQVQGVVSGEAIVRFAFSAHGLAGSPGVVAAPICWELLFGAVRRPLHDAAHHDYEAQRLQRQAERSQAIADRHAATSQEVAALMESVEASGEPDHVKRDQVLDLMDQVKRASTGEADVRRRAEAQLAEVAVCQEKLAAARASLPGILTQAFECFAEWIASSEGEAMEEGSEAKRLLQEAWLQAFARSFQLDCAHISGELGQRIFGGDSATPSSRGALRLALRMQ